MLEEGGGCVARDGEKWREAKRDRTGGRRCKAESLFESGCSTSRARRDRCEFWLAHLFWAKCNWRGTHTSPWGRVTCHVRGRGRNAPLSTCAHEGAFAHACRAAGLLYRTGMLASLLVVAARVASCRLSSFRGMEKRPSTFFDAAWWVFMAGKGSGYA